MGFELKGELAVDCDPNREEGRCFFLGTEFSVIKNGREKREPRETGNVSDNPQKRMHIVEQLMLSNQAESRRINLQAPVKIVAKTDAAKAVDYETEAVHQHYNLSRRCSPLPSPSVVPICHLEGGKDLKKSLGLAWF